MTATGSDDAHATTPGDPPLTVLLRRMSAGDHDAGDRALALLHGHLRALAGTLLAGQPDGHSLQVSALVNEAYLRLARGAGGWNDRRHFLRVAARAMRSVLVDHARHAGRAKRQPAHDGLDALVRSYAERAHDLLDLDRALERLAAIDTQAARTVELRFFAGLTVDETARVLEISRRTVERDWAFARAWLRTEMA